MQIVSMGDDSIKTICWNAEAYFLGKMRKNISKCCLLKFSPSTLFKVLTIDFQDPFELSSWGTLVSGRFTNDIGSTVIYSASSSWLGRVRSVFSGLIRSLRSGYVLGRLVSRGNDTNSFPENRKQKFEVFYYNFAGLGGSVRCVSNWCQEVEGLTLARLATFFRGD